MSTVGGCEMCRKGVREGVNKLQHVGAFISASTCVVCPD